jgi:hypothetical protein
MDALLADEAERVGIAPVGGGNSGWIEKRLHLNVVAFPPSYDGWGVEVTCPHGQGQIAVRNASRPVVVPAP